MIRNILHVVVLLGFVLVNVSCVQRSQYSSTQARASGNSPKLGEAARKELKQFNPAPAPKQAGLYLKKGDKLAICGDSITEQKMYSRIMETYLTVCTPELEISTRQFGWSGEKADGFLARVTNDVLRFDPTIATTCYGMNDHGYVPYEDAIGQRYGKFTTAVVESFKSNDVRVVLGSPGCVGKRPSWSKNTNATTLALNQNLCQLRNMDIEIAQAGGVRFADVFWPMLTASYAAQEKFGTNYAVAGKDGVHPDWAGQVIMAYAFLKALGVDGNLGTITLDAKSGQATASDGHEVVSSKPEEVEIRSSRYPFCATNLNTASDANIRSGMTLVPFDEDLNRLLLVVKNPSARNYRVTWGSESKLFSARQLKSGINLAAEFSYNPFCESFSKVDKAVSAKQSFETKQIKEAFRSAAAKSDMEAVATKTEQERAPLVAAIKAAFVPVTHTIRIQAQ